MPSILGASLSFAPQNGQAATKRHTRPPDRGSPNKRPTMHRRGGGAVPAHILAVETWGPRFAPWRLAVACPCGLAVAVARTGHAVLATHRARPGPPHPTPVAVAGCSVALLRTFLGCLYPGSLVLAFAGRPAVRRVCALHVSAWTWPVAKRRGQSSCFHPLVQVE